MPTEVVEYDASCCCQPALPCCDGLMGSWAAQLFVTAEPVAPCDCFAPFSVPVGYAGEVGAYCGNAGLSGIVWAGSVEWPECAHIITFGYPFLGPILRPPPVLLLGCYVGGGGTFPPGGLAIWFANCFGPPGGLYGDVEGPALVESAANCLTPDVTFITPQYQELAATNWGCGPPGTPGRIRFRVTP